MSNLWVFGDSYTRHSQTNQENFWTFKLAKMLNVKTYHNWSQYGISNEYICDGFMEHSSSISPKDYIIFIITSKSRHWFFENRPEISNLNMVQGDSIIKEEYGSSSVKAVHYFEKYLDSERLNNIKLNWYYGYLNFVETHFPNTLLIPGFDNGFHRSINHEVDGYLYPIGASEFETPDIGEKIFKKKWGRLDRRMGHMADNNHTILAEKVYDTFKNNVTLDLKFDYDKEFINLDNYKDFETIDQTDIQSL